LHMAVECCLDIGSHIISSEKLREPESNKDIFDVKDLKQFAGYMYNRFLAEE